MDVLTRGEKAKFGLFSAKIRPGKQKQVKICIYLLPYTISFPQLETETWLTVFQTRKHLEDMILPHGFSDGLKHD